jgi:hypothetical protein
MTYDFTQVREVELGKGSHSNPQEGMCFMEMAAWFAGVTHSDKPECASRVLGAYGINLNDKMPDQLRDSLLKPLVPLIVGTRDPENEQKRAEFLAMWAVNKIVPIALRANGFEKHALACERAGDLKAAKNAANAAANAATYAADAAYAAANAAANATANATAYAAAYAAYATAYAAANAADIWAVAVEGLRQAILIGKHEGAIAFTERHEALRTLVKETAK